MERRAISVGGVVQGVGFRPFVYRLASGLGLRGFVRNDGGQLRIEVEGESPSLDHFLQKLSGEPPRRARVDRLTWTTIAARGEPEFRVAESATLVANEIAIAPDVATCDRCVDELFNPSDRRHRYPFLNCIDCGPRLTIVTGAPYDRARTTMAGFTPCDACRVEYKTPSDRRFHAEPLACAACGPKLRYIDAIDADGVDVRTTSDPLEAFARALEEGKIGAVKGLGGFHLTCDARRDGTVQALRQRKGREEKPFALMVRDLETATRLCHIDDRERELLASPAGPIVLLRRREGSGQDLSDTIAPGCGCLGLMLPYTPLHHLLLARMAGVPLIMTSGNRSDEPIATTDEDAVDRLRGIADCFLTHDRPIHVRCDDSVVRIVADAPLPMRRSRGFAPTPLALPIRLDTPTLAVGAQRKSTFALGQDARAILSHHVGDLDHVEARRTFERDIALYEDLFDLRPVRYVCDAHPDYASTGYAKARAEREGAELLLVQHHHAHMASCMAEHGLREPVIGVSFDGTGYGTDGAVWGGEFLIGDLRSFRRLGHFDYVPMPGGEAAIREPWRMAAAYLAHAGEGTDLLEARIPQDRVSTIEALLRHGLHCPRTSSAGRLFDGVSSLIGLADRVSYEGQAAVLLEELAGRSDDKASYPVEFSNDGDGWVLRLAPLVSAVLCDLRGGVQKAAIARRFHSFMVEAIRQGCRRTRAESGLDRVTLSGGVFMNAIVLSDSLKVLSEDGFRVYRHERVPANDGGISLGQLAVAAAREDGPCA